MKLGGNIVEPYHTPEEWVNLVKEAGMSLRLPLSITRLPMPMWRISQPGKHPIQ